MYALLRELPAALVMLTFCLAVAYALGGGL